jgi:hypothetical protein
VPRTVRASAESTAKRSVPVFGALIDANSMNQKWAMKKQKVSYKMEENLLKKGRYRAKKCNTSCKPTASTSLMNDDNLLDRLTSKGHPAIIT